ncbi:PQ-loop repeat family protein/transmembrane family protein isoform 5 [Gossypium australe]|uniref:PQ-loop repeat family protein/transmembrane family protein isoform 5 n=1 Tax=Gossypium australe TaxID=47621 RepID=A0A5B6UW45_9ROSI|nr:PQ-loop repeat family protein/transmembrane family protein isoform 5 [Gossypium australe]
MSQSQAYCVKENKPCNVWVERYFKDCLCNLKDDLSFGFGLTSLVCWGVAEIPQIITNFKTKSSHGVSLLFLLTWVVGDVFNLVGCLLEPATLPTQFYTALLYTASTVVLVLQSIYYDYIYRWWKCRRIKADNMIEDEKKPLKPGKPGSGIPIPKASQKPNPRREYYYMYAILNNLRTHFLLYRETLITEVRHGWKQDLALPVEDYYMYRSWLILTRIRQRSTSIHATANNLKPSVSVAGTQYDPQRLWAVAGMANGRHIHGRPNPSDMVKSNATYVASILVRTSEWENIKPNMPWLLDAAVCVALDLVIILQHIYYSFFRETVNSDAEDYGDDHMDASKRI